MPVPIDMFAKIPRAIRRRGWRGMAGLAISKLYDALFDLRYGTDTVSWQEVTSLTGTVGDVAHALHYQPTDVIALRKLLRLLDLEPGRVLVDFGSGKGRVLMVAAPFGFGALRGVEFSAGLCDIARRNIERFRAKTPWSVDFEVLHGDASEYQVRDDEDVFFLFNPFDDYILRRVMENISRSFEATPRPMLLLYRNPVYEACVTDNSPFEKVASHVLWGSDFAVFEAGRAFSSRDRDAQD
jgi:SAM-dependent methyltransferase